MKKAFVPLHHIDALSNGPWDFILQPFQSWLHMQKHSGIRVLILPTPKNLKERFSLGMASFDIRKEADELNLVVVSEARLRRAGLLKRKPAQVVEAKSLPFPSPFSVLVVNEEKGELSLVTT